MALENMITVYFTEEEINEFNEALNRMTEIIRGKTINLSPEERRQYGSIADKNKILVDKCKDYMEQAPQTIPHVVNKESFDRDYKARRDLELPLRRMAGIMEELRDTKILLDHDNYQASLAYYQFVKYLSSQNEPGIDSIYADLKKHYKGGKSRTVNKENDVQTENINTPEKIEKKEEDVEK